MFEQSSSMFGKLGNQIVTIYSVKNNHGIGFAVVDYGATLMSVTTPDKAGIVENISLNYTTLKEMIENHGAYYGCIAGRVANRIAKGKFTVDGKEYVVAVNNGENHLHGGLKGFDQNLWSGKFFTNELAETSGVELKYTSVDGEEGYPGNVRVTVRYELTSDSKLVVTYHANTDAATPINLTNHTYWNLSGNCKTRIYDHTLQLSCSKYLPVPSDGTQIPTGELKDTAGSLFDFSTLRPLRAAVLGLSEDGTGRAGLDHCFVVDGALDPVSGEYIYDPTEQQQSAVGSVVHGKQSVLEGKYLRHVATLRDPFSGRQLELHATQPGVQIYSANWLHNGDLTETPDQSSHSTYFPHIIHNGLCLETQHFPDAVNQSANNNSFPSVILNPQDTYFHQAVYTFRIVDE